MTEAERDALNQRRRQDRASAARENAAANASDVATIPQPVILTPQQMASLTRRQMRASCDDLSLSAFTYEPEKNYISHPFLNIGGLGVYCNFCASSMFVDEPDGLCCVSGKVDIAPIRQPPSPILHLPSRNDRMSLTRKCHQLLPEF